MLILIFILFLFVASLSLIEERLEKRMRQYLFFAVACVLAVITGFRPDDIDHDYGAYVNMYLFNDYDITVEYSFVLICKFVQAFFNHYVFLFLIYAFIAIILDSFAITRLSSLWCLSFLVFLGTSYLMHCMNQIRIAVSAGVFLCAVPYLADKRRWKYLLMMLLAVFFHYTAIVLLGLLFLDNKPLTRLKKAFWYSIVPISYLFYILNIDILMSIPIPYFEEKLEIYERLQTSGIGDEINPFNLVLLVKIAILYFIIWRRDLIEQSNRYVNVLIKIEILSLASFVFLSGLPVVAFRMNELFGVTEIILYPLLFYTVKPEWFAKTIVILLALALMLISIFYNDILFH